MVAPQLVSDAKTSKKIPKKFSELASPKLSLGPIDGCLTYIIVRWTLKSKISTTFSCPSSKNAFWKIPLKGKETTLQPVQTKKIRQLQATTSKHEVRPNKSHKRLASNVRCKQSGKKNRTPCQRSLVMRGRIETAAPPVITRQPSPGEADWAAAPPPSLRTGGSLTNVP